MKLPPATLTPAETGNAGLRLLSAAAAACRRVLLTRACSSPSGMARGSWTSVLNVWHQRGRQTLVQAAAVPADQAAQPLRAAGADPEGRGRRRPARPGQRDQHDPATGHLAGGATPGSRWAARAGSLAGPGGGAVPPRSGTVAARFWLDSATKLPLRRETFDTRARLVTEDMFVSLQLGAPAGAGLPATRTMPSSTPLAGAQLLRLRAAGWPLPGAAAGNLTLVAGRPDRHPGRAGGRSRLSPTACRSFRCSCSAASCRR